MSDEHLSVRATFTATNELSPVLRQILGDIKRLQTEARKVNAAFAGMGNAGIRAMTGYDAATKAAVAQARGLGNTNSRVARDVSQNWRRANDQRLQDSRRLYTSLERMERDYHRQIERRVAAERRAERHASRGGSRGRSGSRLNPPSIRSYLIGGAIGGAGVASSFRKRIETEAAETRAQIFGELSKAETLALRKNYADKAGIKYGVGSTKAIDVAVEGLKAGIAKEFAGQFGELILQAQAGLDIDTAATAKFAGRLATMQGGFNYKNMLSVLNAAAVANNATAADGNEIIEATRRSLSALSSTKMPPEQLVGLNATGVSLGIQPFKMGTFTSFLTSELASAASARGQRAKDLNQAANSLGFGGRTNLAKSMRENPIETIMKILDGLSKLPDELRAKVARQIGMREWSDELLSLVLGRDKLKEVQKDIVDKKGFLSATSLKKIQSLQGRWATITATAGLVWEKIGGGFEDIFRQITDAIIINVEKFNFDSVRDHVDGFVDGLRRGFGLTSWGELVKIVSSYMTSGTVKAWREFGQGFAEGIKDFVNGLKIAFSGLAFLTGSNISDPKSIGKFTAHIGGLTVALSLLSPVLGILSGLSAIIVALSMSPIGRFVMGFGTLMVLVHRGLSYISDKIFSVFVSIVDAVKNVALSIINKVRGWIGLSPISSGGGASGSWSNGSTTANPGSGASGEWNASPARAVKTSLNGTIDAARSVVAVSGSGSINGAEYSRMFAGTPLAGRQAEIEAAAKKHNIPPALLASVIAHETGKGRNVNFNNVGGIMDSETGYSRKKGYATLSDGIDAAARVVAKNHRAAGGDIGKMGASYAPVGAANDPRGLNAAWPKAVAGYQRQLDGGTSGVLGSNPVDVANDYAGMNEYRDRAKLAKFVGQDVVGRANAWCAAFVNASLKATGIKGTGRAVANSYQQWGQGINPADVVKGDVLLQPNGKGYMQTGGHVGLATGRTRVVNGQTQIEMLSGNDNDQVKTSWRNSNKLMARRALQAVPTPTAAVANVPNRNSTATNALLEKNGSALLQRGGGGPVAININGNSHDPEALATLVQRRIDESMNWRTHDTVSEYT